MKDTLHHLIICSQIYITLKILKYYLPLPPGFKDNVFTFSFSINTTADKVWNWLNDTKTFTDTQVWPWRVEFYHPDNQQKAIEFKEGVLTNHQGPMVNFAGILTKIEDNHNRDLQYAYGSYALNFRWIRPNRLEFKTEEEEDGKTKLTGIISTYTKPGLDKFWTKSQRIFWGRCQRWATKSIHKLV